MSEKLYAFARCLMPHNNALLPFRAAERRQLESAQTQMERYQLDASDTRTAGAAGYAAGTWGVF